MLKIIDYHEVLKRNDQNDLVINNVAELHTNFNPLFSSMVGRVHDLTQPGIDKLLGALRQIEVKSNDLNGNSLKRLYSRTPAHVRILKKCQDLRNTNLSSSMRTLENLTLSLNTYILISITLKLLRQIQDDKSKKTLLTSKQTSDLGTSQLFRLAQNLKLFLFIKFFVLPLH